MSEWTTDGLYIWDGENPLSVARARDETAASQIVAAVNRAAGDAERIEVDRLWGAVKNAVDDLETGVENWGDISSIRRNYYYVLYNLRDALSASTAPRADAAAAAQGE